MKKLTLVFTIAAVASMIGLQGPSRADDTTPPTIKSIMKDAFKGPLVKTVGKGEATAEEKQKLLDYSKAMQGLTPPQGDAESWKEKATALVEAAQAAVDGSPNASALLMKATNCAACHGPHKPK